MEPKHLNGDFPISNDAKRRSIYIYIQVYIYIYIYILFIYIYIYIYSINAENTYITYIH